MAAHHLVGNAAGDLGEGEPAGLFGHPRVIDHLEQQVAKFIRQGDPIAADDRVGHLVRLLDRVGGNAGEALFPVPGAAVVGVAQRGHDVEKATKFGLGAIGHGWGSLQAYARR